MKLIKQPHGGYMNRLEKGETANPNGRPKKLFSSLALDMKERGYEAVKPAVIVDAYESLLGLDRQTLEEVKDDTQRPEVLRIIAEYLLKKEGRFMIIESLLDRVHGKALQKYAGEVKHEIDDKGREAVEHALKLKS